MQLPTTFSLIQRAKALAQVQSQVESLLPAGVQLMNIREGIWVLSCVPFLRTRIRFMVPELEKKLSEFAGKPVKIEIKSHIPESPVSTIKVVVEPIVMSSEVRAKVLRDAKMIEDEKIRRKFEQLIAHVP